MVPRRMLIVLPLSFATAMARSVDQNALWGHIHTLFPQAGKLTSAAIDPPVAQVETQGIPSGHLLLTDRLAPIPASSRHPISLMVGLDLDGVIRGVRVIEHREPILGAAVNPAMRDDFVEQYRGLR